VGKPIQPMELYQAIAGMVPLSDDVESESPAPSPMSHIFDRDEALKHVGGDLGLLKDIGQLFFRDCPTQLADLRQAIARQDSKTVHRLAHTIKGGVSHFGARKVIEAAQLLETMGKNGDLSRAEAAYQALEENLARLKPALAALAYPGVILTTSKHPAPQSK
jgi:HPt (histidine-containing phosphotransfer) domain-containing protein